MAAGHSTTTDNAMRERGYLLVAEAARKLGCAPSTIYRWVSEDKVRGFREGYRRYVMWPSILKHLGPEAVEVRGLTEDDVWEESGLDE